VSPARFTERQLALASFVAVCVIWGTTYLAIRVAIETLPPFLMSGARWLLAGTLLWAGLRARGRRLPPRSSWRAVAVIAFLLLIVGNGAVVWAEQFVTSGLTAVIIASNPFWMVAIDALFGGDRVSGRAVTGLTVGFLGIVLLVWPELRGTGAAGPGFLAGVLALQLACAGWAAGSSWSKRHSQHADVFAMTALQMLIGGVMFLGVATLAGEWQMVHASSRSLVAFLYLATVGSIGGYVAYTYALKHLPVALVSLYAYINPIIAVVLGMLLLGEPFTIRMAVAAVIVLLGVWFVRAPSAPAAAAPRRATSTA